MRSLTLSLILLAGVATHAHAQGTRVTAPIAKAREASANADARAKALDAAGQDPVARRDSTTDAANGAPAVQKPAAKRPPSLPPVNPSAATASNAPASKAAGVKPETTAAANPVASKTASKAPTTAAPANAPVTANTKVDSAKPSAAGKAAPTSDKNIATTTSAQVAPGKSPAGSKAPPVLPAAGSKAAPVTPDSAKTSATAEAAKGAAQPTSVGSAPSSRPEIAINREVFQYDASGRRDPFASLLLTSDLRPIFSDLLLVVINYDPQGRNSVAIMRDAVTKEQYRVRQGQLIGRMRVAAIEPKRVMFTIDEFGFSRQETLVIGDTTKVRKQ